MNKAFKNIKTIQKQVKNSINNFLNENGYSLVNNENFDNSEMVLFQWTNQLNNQTFQLIWDNKEQWFDLGEFHQIDNLNYTESILIELYPYSVNRIIFRRR